MKHIFIILSCSLLTGMLMAQETLPLWPAGNIPYSQGNTEDDVPVIHAYPTAGDERHCGAAVVICPGGGYGGLASDHEGHQVALWMNERGVSAYVLRYRLGSKGYHFPTQLADVQRAIRYVRRHAEEWEIDPERIGIMGFSAGGHLASMGATKFNEQAYPLEDGVDEMSARPNVAVLCYPVISMNREITHGGSRKNLLGPDADNDEKAKHVSSELNVTPETPPTFLFHTVEDSAVPVENSLRFFEALRKNGIPAELHAFQKGPHGVGLYRGDPALRNWSRALHHWLRAQGFFSGPVERTAVSGTVELDGTPVSWGSFTFYPEDGVSPIVTVRARRGKFSAKVEDGPVLARSRVVFEGSVWEETGAAEDVVVRLDRLTPDSEEELILDLQADQAPLDFQFESR